MNLQSLIAILITVLLVFVSFGNIFPGLPVGIPTIEQPTVEPASTETISEQPQIELLPTASDYVVPTASVDSVPVDSASNPVVLLSNPISMSGVYDMQHYTAYDSNHNTLNLTVNPMDVDVRLDAILNPMVQSVVWDPSDSESFDNNGVRFIKVYHTKSADEINSMNPADRVPYTIFVDESHIVTQNAQSNSATENVFKSRFRESEVRSFALLGQVSKSVYQIQITFMVISNSTNHDLVINNHVVHYVDILVYIPGKGMVKHGLAVGADDDASTMFRGTETYTQTSKIDNYLGMYNVPTKIIFEDDNPYNFNTAFTANKWFMNTDMFGMPIQEFAIHSGDTPFQNMHIGEESIKYLPFLPSNYYADFLKSGGESFVVFFPGSDVSGANEFIGTFESPFTDTEVSQIRSEWDESGNWVK